MKIEYIQRIALHRACKTTAGYGSRSFVTIASS